MDHDADDHMLTTNLDDVGGIMRRVSYDDGANQRMTLHLFGDGHVVVRCYGTDRRVATCSLTLNDLQAMLEALTE